MFGDLIETRNEKLEEMERLHQLLKKKLADYENPPMKTKDDLLSELTNKSQSGYTMLLIDTKDTTKIYEILHGKYTRHSISKKGNGEPMDNVYGPNPIDMKFVSSVLAMKNPVAISADRLKDVFFIDTPSSKLTFSATLPKIKTRIDTELKGEPSILLLHSPPSEREAYHLRNVLKTNPKARENWFNKGVMPEQWVLRSVCTILDINITRFLELLLAKSFSQKSINNANNIENTPSLLTFEQLKDIISNYNVGHLEMDFQSFSFSHVYYEKESSSLIFFDHEWNSVSLLEQHISFMEYIPTCNAVLLIVIYLDYPALFSHKTRAVYELGLFFEENKL